ncbi:MAG: transposase [Pseudomonadota bacterium]
MKTPYRDGTTHIVLDPLDLMARLAALVPPPRMHLARFHGVFSPHSKLRAAMTLAHRGVGGPGPIKPPTGRPPRHVAMTWAQRMKRVFGIEISTCTGCGGKLKVIASIEESQVIAKILAQRVRETAWTSGLLAQSPRGQDSGKQAGKLRQGRWGERPVCRDSHGG